MISSATSFDLEPTNITKNTKRLTILVKKRNATEILSRQLPQIVSSDVQHRLRFILGKRH